MIMVHSTVAADRIGAQVKTAPSEAQQRLQTGGLTATTTGLESNMRAVPRVEHYTRPVIRGDQHCPTCGLPPERDDARLNRMGVGQATFLCEQGHMWSIHWVVAA